MNARLPSRMSVIGLLLCLIAGLVLPFVHTAAAAVQVGGRKPRPGAYLLDDWAGRAAQLDWAAGSAVKVGWRDIEPQEGQYAFERIDAWLAALKAGGKPGSIELRLSCKAAEWITEQEGQEACAPEWALAWDPVLVGTQPHLNYLDGRVKTAISELAGSIARRYASDPRLSHLTLGLGFDGSASPCDAGRPAATASGGSANSSPEAEARCTAYRNRYADGMWAQHLVDGVGAFADAFERSGGANHAPLLVAFTGATTPEERQALVDAAVGRGVGLYDPDWAASFHTGDFRAAGCTDEAMATGADGRPAGGAAHWETLSALAGQAPVAVQLREQPRKSELALSDEENAWWSVLNALDKGSDIFYVAQEDAQWGAAWRYFNRFAGKRGVLGAGALSNGGATAAWIALRGAEGSSCGDAGDFSWQIARNERAAGGSARRASASQPGGRTGEGWRGAYTRSTDVGNQQPGLYFDVDDALIYGGEHIVVVEVTYYDGDLGSSATWELTYDSSQGPNQRAGEVSLQGTGKWLVHAFVLTDAAFGNRLSDLGGMPGNDLSLIAHGGDVSFHMVSLRILPDGDGGERGTPSGALRQVTLPSASTPAPETLAPRRETPVARTTARPETAGSQAVRDDDPAEAITPTGAELQATPAAEADPSITDLAGATDTYLDSLLPDENFASANNLVVRGDGRKLGLLRFDLSSLPTDASIAAAWLELTVVGRTRPATMTLSLEPLQSDWAAEAATWNNTEEANAARVAALRPPVRAELPSIGSVQVPLTELVRDWIAAPETNRGLALRGAGAADLEYYIASSEWRGVVARPRLRVRFGDGLNRVSRSLPTVAPSSPTPMPAATRETGPSTAALSTAPPEASGTPGVAPAGVAPGASTDALRVHVVAVETDPNLGEARAKVTVYVYGPNGESAGCGFLPMLDLWAAAGQRPAQLIAGSAVRRLETAEGRTFPVWEFKDVDLAAVRQGDALLHVFATAGATSRHNVVTLGAAGGTRYPAPAAPLRSVPWDGGALDASLEIVWPQDGMPLEGVAPLADKANLSVALFRHGTREVLQADSQLKPVVRLHWSLNDGPDLAGANPPIAQPRLVQTPWLNYYLWDFPDIDISPAQQSGNYLNFWVEVEGFPIATTNVWSHGYGPHPAPLALPPAIDCAPAVNGG